MGDAVICAACRLLVPIEEALGFWRQGDPSSIRFVCRPDGPRKHCFMKVGPRSIHAIASGPDARTFAGAAA